MELSSLRIFKTVAEEGSVTQAAAKLHRVQSNVSARLNQLEESLGVSLFHRSGRRMLITEEGARLLDYADRLLRLADEAQMSVRGDQAPAGQLRIGSMETTAAARLPVAQSWDVLGLVREGRAQYSVMPMTPAMLEVATRDYPDLCHVGLPLLSIDLFHALTPRQAATIAFGGLTQREREIAGLIAGGSSNAGIAKQLVVSERTVETHVTNILAKLGFSSRSQIAAWAVENSLITRT